MKINTCLCFFFFNFYLFIKLILPEMKEISKEMKDSLNGMKMNQDKNLSFDYSELL
jgi:hypothetical protein